MKNQKLKLNDLKVKSFTTEIDADNQNTVNGGAGNVALNTKPMCNLISKFFVCEIKAPTHTWDAECGRRG
ncbi:MAG: pinensin family lanthipeptide [Bacteroidota bacterium]